MLYFYTFYVIFYFLILIMISNLLCIVLIFLISFNVAICWNWPWNSGCLSMEPHLIVEAFEKNISSTLCGQHLVEDYLMSTLLTHLEGQPKKALALSFHGAPGVGKTFVAKKIGYTLFGPNSDYVKFYSGRNDFTDSVHVNIHKERLSNEIRTTVTQCPHALFIFDEANYMANGLFDVLRPYLDFLDHFQGVDYRRAIFIFISNIGAGKISQIYMEKMKQDNFRRESLKLLDFEDALSYLAYNENGGLNEVNLIKNFLVDFYLPFLPLEEEHIKFCIGKEMMDQGVPASNTIINAVYKSLPKEKNNNGYFVTSNCKQIPAAVAKFLGAQQRKARNTRNIDEF